MSFCIAGCSTLDRPPSFPEGHPAELDVVAVLPLVNTNLAASLAAYTAGLQAETLLDSPEALRCYLEAIRLNPSEPELYLRAMRRLEALNRNDEVPELLDRAQAAMPDRPEPVRWMAIALGEAGRMEEAEAEWRRLLNQFPDRQDFPLEAARALFAADRFAPAIELLESRLERFGHPREYHLYLADLHGRNERTAGDRAGAERMALQRAVDSARRFPGEEGLRSQAARRLIRAGDLGPALRHLEELESFHPDTPALKSRLAAVIMRAHGDPAMAIAALTRHAEANPKDGRARQHLGLLLHANGKPEEALACFEQAMALEPAEATPWLMAAQIRGAKNPADALPTLEKAYLLFPGHPVVLENLANLRFAAGEYAGAVEIHRILHPSLLEQPNNPSILRFYLQYAVAALRDGDPMESADALARAMTGEEAAVAEYARAVLESGHRGVISNACVTTTSLEKDFPNSALLKHTRAILHSRAGNLRAAYADFKAAEGQYEEDGTSPPPFNASNYFRYGQAAEFMQRMEEAEEKLMRSVQLDGTQPGPLNYLAYFWASQNRRLEEALALSDKSLRLDPLNPSFLDTRGWIHFRMGNAEKAVEDLEAAAGIAPHPEILDHLGDVLRALGRLEEAGDAYRMALVYEDESMERVREKCEAVSRERAAQPPAATPQPEPAATPDPAPPPSEPPSPVD